MATVLQAPRSHWMVGQEALAGASPTSGSNALPLWQPALLGLLAGLVLFANLDSVLLEPDEGRYAELPRLMNQSGDYLTPRLGGKPYNDKPPLVYWLIAGSYQLFGTSALSARLVMAVMAATTLLATYAWTYRYLGSSAAFLAGLILCSMLGFVAFGRMLLLDSTLAACVVVGLLSGHHALASGHLRWRWWLLSAFSVGLGGLAKGPVALVLVLPPLLGYRWLDRHSQRWGWQAGLAYLAVVLTLMLPWYLAMLFTNESFFREHVIRHHVMRFLQPYHHRQPFWYYGPAWFAEMLPWSGIALAALGSWRSWTGPLRLVVCAGVFGFVFFSAAAGKLPTYLLPLLPFNAVLCAQALVNGWTSLAATRRHRWLLAAGVIVLIFAVIIRGHIAEHFLNQDPHIFDWLVLVAIPPTLAGLWPRLTPATAFGLLGAAGLWVTALVAWHVIPDHAAQASRGLPAGRLARWADFVGIPVVAYRGSWEAASFYRGREELRVFHFEETSALAEWLRAQPWALVLVRIDEGRLAQLLGLIPPGSEVVRVLGAPSPIRGVLIRQVPAVDDSAGPRENQAVQVSPQRRSN
jgi:4-amino-4-deoxy-L-arabinose transferase-like glycosyltransferase